MTSQTSPLTRARALIARSAWSPATRRMDLLRKRGDVGLMALAGEQVALSGIGVIREGQWPVCVCVGMDPDTGRWVAQARFDATGIATRADIAVLWEVGGASDPLALFAVAFRAATQQPEIFSDPTLDEVAGDPTAMLQRMSVECLFAVLSGMDGFSGPDALFLAGLERGARPRPTGLEARWWDHWWPEAILDPRELAPTGDIKVWVSEEASAEVDPASRGARWIRRRNEARLWLTLLG